MVMLLALVRLTACHTKESSKIENSITYEETTVFQGNTDADSSYIYLKENGLVTIQGKEKVVLM